MKIEIQTKKDKQKKLKEKAKKAVFQNTKNLSDKEKKTAYEYGELQEKEIEAQNKWNEKKKKNKKTYKKEKGVWKDIKTILSSKLAENIAILLFVVILLEDVFVAGRVFQAKKDLASFNEVVEKYKILAKDYQYYKEHSWTLSSYDENQIVIK